MPSPSRVALVVVLVVAAVTGAVLVIAGDDDGGDEDRLEIEVSQEQLLDDLARMRQYERVMGSPRPRQDAEGVLFRAVVDEGPMVSLESDGRVVYVLDRTVTSSTDDYRSLRLDEEGTQRLADTVFDALLERGAEEDTGVGVFHGGGFFNVAPAPIGARLADLSWLEEHVVEPLGPWVPEELSIEAHPPLPAPPSPLRAEDPFAPWPLDVRVDELPHRVVDHPYGERLAICLVGDQAAKVFALLTGVNHAYLRVDDGRRWELNVDVHSPGYRLHGSACESEATQRWRTEMPTWATEPSSQPDGADPRQP